MRRPVLIPWRQVLRFWSVQLNALGLLILGWIQFDPVGVLEVWSLLPDDVRAIFPPRTMMVVGMVLVALSIVARTVKQPKLHEGDE